MRRTAVVLCLLASIVLGSRPDAAFVPIPRTPDTAAPRRADTGRARSAAMAKPAPMPLPARPPANAVAAFAPPAATMTMPLMPMQPVGRTATTTTLTVAPNPSSLTAPITLTASVAVVPPATGVPTGIVRFRANGAVIGSAPVAASGLAVFTTGFVVPGSLDLTASYVGDTTFAPSTSDIVPHVTSAAANSTLTAIVTSPSPSPSGAAVTVLALVFPLGAGTPTGTVEFRDGGTPIATSSLVSFSGLQIAVTTLNPATPGARTLTAHYAGDATHTGSVSPPTIHTVYTGVAPSVTTTVLTASPASSLVGQPVTLTATVTRAAGGVAAGTVDFFAGGVLLGSQTLAAGGGAAQAALTVSSLPKGIALLSAAYRGNATSAASATFFPVFQCVDCTAANATPFADAGPVQAVTPGALVQLDGSRSSDLEGAPLTYTWTPVTTSPFTPATLTNPTSARPTFVAAAVQTYYAFDLVVSDGTLSSPPSRTYVVAAPSVTNAAPIASAGPDQFVTAEQGVTLSGTGSFDPDGQPSPLTYRWVMRSAPPGSIAELDDTTSSTPSFYLDLEGRYEFELVVFDGARLSAADRVVVATNHPPIARAGDDQERAVGTTAHLSGAGSTDEDGQALTYSWTLVSRPLGSSAVLSGATSVLPTLILDQPGNYVARLIVHDGTDPSDPDTVTISSGDLAPVADPGPARFAPGGNPTSGALSDDRPAMTVTVGQTVWLDGTASWDPNFQFTTALNYAWTLVQRPAGSAAVLTAPTSARPTFVADVAGVYVARLVVMSSALSSVARDIRITTGNSRPIADAGLAHLTPVSEISILDASGSTDVNGDPLSYQWSLLSKPVGSTATIADDSSPRAQLVPDVGGVYVAQVLVSDGEYADAATVLIATTATVLGPIGRAGADQAVPAPSAVSLDGNASTDPGFDPLTYRWVLMRKPAGSAAALSGPTTALPGFPVDVAGDYIAQLRVSDPDRYSPVDTVVVTTGNAVPLANAGADQNAAVGGVVSLDGTSSSDANGTPLIYEWSMLYRPDGSAAALSNPAAADPTFVADLPGTYVVQLITSDGTLRSAADTVVVTTVAAPVAVAIAPDTAYAGTSVPLDGSGSSDPQLLPLAYVWSFGSRPAGSVASIENPLAAMTAFTPDLVGTYVVCLAVSNGAVSSAADCETIAVSAAPALTLTPSVLNLALNETASMTVTLDQPAGPSDVMVSLVASTSVTVPASVTIPAGQSSAAFDVTAGATDGTATIGASASGYAGDQAHVNISVSGITITLGAGLVVAPQQIRDLSLTLSEPAPPGGVLITLTSSNPAVAPVTPSIFVPEGADVPMGNPQVIGLAYGMTEISASAADFAGDTEIVAVARSISLAPSPLNVVVGGTGDLLLQASAPAPAGGLGFNVNVDTAGVLGLPSVVTIQENQLTAPIAVAGQTLGSAVITVTPTDAADTSSASATVNVTAAQPINLQSATVGFQLQTWVSGSLGAPAPPGGRIVTITSGDTNLVWLATADAAGNAASIQLFVPAGATQLPSFLVRGDDESGSVVLTASSPGLPDGTSTVTLTPSGLVFGTGNFVTGLFSPNIVVTVHHARLDPVSLMPVERQLLAAGIKVAGLAIENSNPTVGVLGTPVFDIVQRFWSVSFDPLAAGTTVLGLPQNPAPAAGTQITITVAAPLTFSSPALTVGRNLQAPVSLNLGSPAPAGNLPVTIATTDPAKVLLSKTVAGAGSASISFTVPAGSTNTPPFYVQALDESGTVAVTATAANYEPASLPVTLVPSGVVFAMTDFTTHPASPNTTLTLGTAWLEPGTLAYVPGPFFACDRCQAVRGGLASFQVTVVSSDNPIGSVPNPATFNAGSATSTTEFDPHAAGTVTLSIVTPVAPAGFSTPANGAAIQADITPATATLSAGGVLIGKNLQSSNSVALGEPAPAGNLLVTIQSTDQSKVLLSTTPSSPGMDTITLTVAAGQTGSPQFYVHALDATGVVGVNLTAPGYLSGSFDVTLKPSGFIFRTGSFSTSTLSPDTPLEMRAVWLDEGTLEYPVDPFCTRCQPLATGASAEVSVSSSPTTVGTITVSPVTIAASTGIGTTAFHPLSGGTATLSLGTPPGFSTPSTFREITASVGNPPLTIADLIVGKDLQGASVVNLGAPAEPGGVAITVSTLDPNLRLSTSPTSAGSSSILLDVASGATQSPAFYVHALTASGAAQIGATASGYSPAAATVSFRPSGIVFASGDFTTGALSPNTAVTVRSVWLDPISLTWAADLPCTSCQAVRGGIATLPVSITSSDPSVGTVTGAAFSGGDATATAAFDPQANGTTTLGIVAPDGFSASGNFSSIAATVQPALQLGGAIVGRDLQTAVGGFATVPAPAGNLLVTLQSSDPSKLLLATNPTVAGQASIVVTIPAGSGSFGYFVQALTNAGSAQVLASAPGHSDGQTVITFVPSGFALEATDFTIAPDAPNASLLIRSVRLDPDFLNYITDPSCTACQAVRPGVDVTVDVTSSNPAIGSIVGTAQFTGGVGSQFVQFDPHTVGTTTVALGTTPAPFSTPSNLQSIEVTVATPPPTIAVQALTLGRNLQSPLSGSLGAPAPAGNLEVTLTSADPDKVLLSASPTTVGSSSIIITVPAGSSTLPEFYVQALSDTGTVQLTASAAGYLTGNSLVTLWPSGFVILTADFTTSPTAVPTEVQVRPVRIDPIFHNFTWDQGCSSCQNLRAGFTADVPVVSADDAIGTITVSPLSFAGNDGVKSTGFDGASAGTVAVSLSAVAGFETPSNLQSLQVTVTDSYVAFAGVTGAPSGVLGKNLQTPVTGSLGLPAPAGNLEITIASADPSKVLLSSSPNLPGADTLTVTVPAGSTTVPTIYAQGLDSVGTVALTVSAPGFVGNPFSLTLAPSGFAFMTIGVSPGDTQDFTTTSASADTLLAIHPVRLEAGTLNLPPWAFSLCYNICQQLRPGITASVGVTSSNSAVGTISNSPLTFDHTANGLSAVFDPASAGTTTLTVVAPPGFSQPGSQASLVATVTAPPLTIAPAAIGKNLQVPVSVNLGSPAPAGNLEVTISSADPSKVLLSASGGAGSASITVTVPAGQTSSPQFYVQALADTGVGDITASAPGYASGTAAMTLHPSGFVIAHIYWCLWCGSQEIQTTAGAADTGFYLVAVRLNPVSLNAEEGQKVRGGLTVDVTVSTTPTGVGTIVPTPVTVTGGTAFESGVATLAFDPSAAGTTLVEVVTPPGFSPSSSHRTMTATVTNAALSLPDQSIGKNLQVPVSVALVEPAPAGGLDVTVSSADASKLLISADPSAQGTVSALVHAAAGQTSVTVYAQALSDSGSVVLTASAPSRGNGTATMSLTPAGFALAQVYWCFSCVPQTISTTTGSANTQMYVVAGRLNAGTGDFEATQSVRGGLSVDVTVSSTPTIGTNVMALVPPTVTFTGGAALEASVAGIQADPLSAGVTVLEVVTPSGFAASNTFRTITATVSGPALALADLAIGKDLQSPVTVSLQEPAPAGGVDITLTSGDISKVLISADATTAGSASAAVHVPAGSQSATFHAQALAASGTVSLTATGTGFSQGGANATLQPSGFVIGQLYWCLNCFGASFNTTTGSPNTPLDVVAARLTPATFVYDAAQPIRGGHTVNVTVVSTDTTGTNVGTMTPSTLTFTGGVSVAATAFDPINPGVAIVEPVPPAGFSSPSTFRQLTANVTAPGIVLAVNTVGKDLQTTASGTLSAPAPSGGLSVTIDSVDAARLRLSLTPADPGGASISLAVAEGSTTLPTFYLQALDGSGSVDITASATGYTSGMAAVPLAPSGFVMLSPGTNFTTTTLSDPTTLSVYSAALSPTLTYLTMQPVRPGASVAVTVTAVDSTGTGVGTITGSPATFNGNEGVGQAFFDPASQGSSIITVVPPAGFSTPANFRVFTATVNAPPMFVGDALLGKDLQTAMAGSLGGTSPIDVTVTITSTDPSKVLLSALPTTVGSSSIVITSTGPTNVIPAFYVQGLANSGTVTLNISAPGFLPTTAQVHLTPSGFIIQSPGNFTTQGNAPNQEVQISSARLDPTLVFQASQPLRPGASASVPVTSSQISVGAITLSPVTFSGNQGLRSTFFDPQPVTIDGATTIQIGTPAGFSTPTQYQSIGATVTAVTIDPNATSSYSQWLLGAPAAPNIANFEPFSSGTILSGSEYATAGLTIVQRDGFPMRIASAGDGSFVLPGNFNSPTNGLTSSFLDDSKSENYDFNFAHTVMSAGLWIGHMNPGGPTVLVQFLDPTETVIQSYTASAADPNLIAGGNPLDTRLFVGLNSTVPIAKIRVFNGVGDGDGIVFDDVTFSGTFTTLSLTPGSSSVNVGGAAPLSLTLSQALASDLTVTLESSDPAAATVPVSVLVAAGATSASFDVTGIATGGALITASAPGTAPGKAVVAVGGNIVEWISNTSGVWSQGANWSTGAPPGAADVVRIDRPGNITVFVDAGGAARTLLASETVTVASALTIANAAAFDGGLNLQATLQGAGRASVRGTSTWASGVLALGGGLDIEAGQTLTILLANEHRVQSSALRNHGRVVFSAGTVTATINGTILNAAGAVWEAQGDRQIASDFSGGTNTFTNAGVFRRTSGTGALTFGGGLISFFNSGTMEIQTGTVNAAVAFNNTGHLSVAAGAEIPLSNFTLGAGSTFSGGGVLKLNGATTVNGTLTIPVALEMTGNVSGAGQLTMTAPMTWVSGIVQLGGGLDIESGQTLTISTGNEHRVQSSALRNRGTVIWTGGIIVATINGSVLNDAGAVWEAQGDRQIASDFSGGTNTFTNAGLFRRTSGVGVFTFGSGLLSIVNTGTMDFQTGSVNAAVPFSNTGHLSVSPGAEIPLSSFTLGAGTTFSGSGLLKLNGTTTVNANLTVPVALEMTGNVSGPGQLTMTAPMTWISGIVQLGGGLDIESGQTLTISTANDHRVYSSALRNRGTVIWTGGTVVATINGSVLNDVGAVWEAQGDRQIASDFSGGTNTFTNAGLFRRTSGVGVLTFGGGLITFYNSGTIDIQTGTLNAAVSLINTGHLSVSPGASIPLSNFTLGAGSTFSGGGTLQLNGTTTVNASLTVPVALEMTGNVSGPGQLTMTAMMNWLSGTIGLGGGLDIEVGQTLNIQTGNDHRVQSSALRNRGSVVWGSGTVSATLNGTILNDVGGIWDAQGTRQIASDFSGGTNTFTNAGELRNTAPSGTLTIGGGLISFINTGTIVQRIFNASDYDRINVTGQFTMGGTLDVRLASGFVPALTDVFTLQTFGSRVGTFATINGNGHAWTPCYGATSLLLGDPANGAFCAGP